MTPNSPAKEYRPFAVSATVTREVSFLVDARTAEEAQAIVEEWIEDGESGTVNSTEVEFDDVFPADGIETEETRNASAFPINRSHFARLDYDPADYLD